ncbi:MAG: hypothetical protein DRH08_04135 [Deltaproteobacteria bacterium]|nr:MAG: hypothetical protein DRH08_04135 [Deltaproteobacteria bacterium]
MKTRAIISLMLLVLLCPFYAAGSDFEDESTPIEHEDVKTVDEINESTSFEDESTQIEKEDIKTIDQVNGEDSFENESTPIEQEDIKTLDQVSE